MGTKDSFTDIDDFLDEHYVGTAWLCEYTNEEGNKVSLSSSQDSMKRKMEGRAPTLTFEFAPTNSNQSFNTVFNAYKMKSTRDVPVTVTATIQGYHCGMDKAGTMQSIPVAENEYITDLTRTSENIMFAHYNEHDSTWGSKTCAHDPDKDEFIVHVINAITQLTISKSGWNSNDPNQTFLFRVTGKDGDGNNIDLIVTVHEGRSVTIDGLIIDNQYNVTELTDWSWRYNFKSWSFSDGTSGTKNDASITLGETGNIITFTNERPRDKWLDGDSWLDNLFSLFGN
jgi:hypothetical protein